MLDTSYFTHLLIHNRSILDAKNKKSKLILGYYVLYSLKFQYLLFSGHIFRFRFHQYHNSYIYGHL